MMYKGKNFSFELFRNHNVVYGSFIDFNSEDIRGKGVILNIPDNNVINKVQSETMPELYSTKIFVPGFKKTNDTMGIYKILDNPQRAEIYYNEAIVALIKADEYINK